MPARQWVLGGYEDEWSYDMSGCLPCGCATVGQLAALVVGWADRSVYPRDRTGLVGLQHASCCGVVRSFSVTNAPELEISLARQGNPSVTRIAKIRRYRNAQPDWHIRVPERQHVDCGPYVMCAVSVVKYAELG